MYRKGILIAMCDEDSDYSLDKLIEVDQSIKEFKGKVAELEKALGIGQAPESEPRIPRPSTQPEQKAAPLSVTQPLPLTTQSLPLTTQSLPLSRDSDLPWLTVSTSSSSASCSPSPLAADIILDPSTTGVKVDPAPSDQVGVSGAAIISLSEVGTPGDSQLLSTPGTIAASVTEPPPLISTGTPGTIAASVTEPPPLISTCTASPSTYETMSDNSPRAPAVSFVPTSLSHATSLSHPPESPKTSTVSQFLPTSGSSGVPSSESQPHALTTTVIDSLAANLASTNISSPPPSFPDMTAALLGLGRGGHTNTSNMTKPPERIGLGRGRLRRSSFSTAADQPGQLIFPPRPTYATSQRPPPLLPTPLMPIGSAPWMRPPIYYPARQTPPVFPSRMNPQEARSTHGNVSTGLGRAYERRHSLSLGRGGPIRGPVGDERKGVQPGVGTGEWQYVTRSRKRGGGAASAEFPPVGSAAGLDII